MNLKTRNKLSLALLALASLLTTRPSSANEVAPASRESFNAGWRFTKGDPAEVGDRLKYSTIKPWLLAADASFSTNAAALLAARPSGIPGGDVASYAKLDFDDSKWRLLNLPHDWGVEGPFSFDYPGNTGKLPWWGVAWYRKHLQLAPEDAGKKIFLDLDGAMAYATVWCNGQFVGGWPYGFASWRVDLTPFLHAGADNAIAIRLDNPQWSSRWYPGGGIYRNVWLVKTAPVHVAHWGTQITTPEVSESKSTVKVHVNVDNDSDSDSTVSIRNEIRELTASGKPGRKMGTLDITDLKVSAHQSGAAEGQIDLEHVKLWDIGNPNRYVVLTSLLEKGKAVDAVETPIGFRTIEFTATNGFLLNGKRVQINGVCDHADLGALGSVVNVRGLERQLEILRSFGCNAIRTSHNPPAPELLDLCDRMGFIVMDEYADCWHLQKVGNGYNLLYDDWHEMDVRSYVRRDRNHPCVVLWSIGNEIPEQSKKQGPAMEAMLSSIVHQEDPTRPTGLACSDTKGGYNGYQKNVDVFGYNYKPYEYGRFREKNPSIPLIGSETASCISSRGEYFFPYETNKAKGNVDFQVNSYDLCAPSWATIPDAEFTGQERFPFIAGEFVWTGFDYLGEPTPYWSDSETNKMHFSDPAVQAKMDDELKQTGKILVPSRSSYFGIVDLAGFPKDRYYIYQAHWRPDFPMAHILPHWNWPDRIGQVTPVHVYTSGDEAELFLNGKSLGRQKKGPLQYRLIWADVNYEPGTLKVVAYKNGSQWATNEVKTTGAPEQILMQADRLKIAADGLDLSYITVKIADKDGLLVPRSKNHLSFAIDGPGEIVATDNGDATSFEPFQAPEHNAYNGLALVIVRSKPGQSGSFTLKATSDGLKPAEINLRGVSN
jgi:beta-galactosidase